MQYMGFKRIFYSLFIILFVASCQLGDKTITLKSGDIIFVEDVQSDLSKAINDVTQKSTPHQYTHVGIIEKVQDSLFVIHASTKNGVERISLKEFVCQENNDSSTFHIYRVDKKDIDHQQVIQQAQKYIGLPYNWSYMLSDTSQYCSELVFNAFENFNIFTVEPMSFKNPNTGEDNPTWVEYFKKRNEEVPEGFLGCNPNGLSQTKNLKLIIGATCFDAKDVQFYRVEGK